MSIPLHHLAQAFQQRLTAHIPLLGHSRGDGVLLQRLAQRLAPHVKGGLTFTGEDVQQLVDLYVKDIYTVDTQKDITHFFMDYLTARTAGIKPQGLALLADELGKSIPEVHTEAVEAGKFIAGNVFGSVKNVALGCSHTFRVRKGLDGTRNLAAGALAYGGAALLAHTAFRSLAGRYEDEQGYRHNRPASLVVEGLAGLGAIAAALKVTEKNILLRG